MNLFIVIKGNQRSFKKANKYLRNCRESYEYEVDNRLEFRTGAFTLCLEALTANCLAPLNCPFAF